MLQIFKMYNILSSSRYTTFDTVTTDSRFDSLCQCQLRSWQRCKIVYVAKLNFVVVDYAAPENLQISAVLLLE